MPSGPDQLLDSLKYIATEVSATPNIDEDELYNIIRDSEFFSVLGYTTIGRDIRQQKALAGSRKKPDFYCTDEYQNVIFVIEAKRPSDSALEAAFDQLWRLYVLPLKSKFGILTNGNQLIVFRRHEREAVRLLAVSTTEATMAQAEMLWTNLRKPSHEISVYSEFKRYLATTEQMSLREGIARENFLQTFELKQDSVFGSLVSSLMSMFDYALENSKFLRGAYSYWLNSLARTPEHIPESWKPFLEGKPEDHIYRFMFSVETSHALLARLMLAKACQDYQFPYVDVYEFMQTNIPRVREHIPSAGYPLTVAKLLSEMRGLLVSSVFEDDIFGWWSDVFKEFASMPGWKLEEQSLDHRLERFCGALADLLLTLYKYNYFDLQADVLGDLYQTYFDAETRKALGEFYTPDEVVEYILDNVDYTNILHKRLIDPSCGSGTFLVKALRRYLVEVAQSRRTNFSEALKDLCSSPKIVGLDIHPFAVLISQVRFMLELLPLYKAALMQEGRERFRLQRLPIFRTDSLALETKPEEAKTLPMFVKTEHELKFTIALPMSIQAKDQVTLEVAVPSWADKSLQATFTLSNLDEYFQATQALFDTLKDSVAGNLPEIGLAELESSMRNYLPSKSVVAISKLYKPYGDNLLSQFITLRADLEDGRLLKSIEEAVLAALLKSYFSYDFVVANPPYVRVQRLPERLRGYLRSNYTTAFKKFDLFVVFIERGIRWMNEEGRLGYIVPNRFISREYAGKLRNLITTTCTINLCIDFGDSGVFRDATNYPSILILTKGRRIAPLKFVRVKKSSGQILKTISSGLRSAHFANEAAEIYSVKQPNQGESAWKFHRADIESLLRVIERNSTHVLGQVSERIDEGIKTGADDVFVIDEEVASKFNLEKALLKPVLHGAEVRRWVTKWGGEYLLYPHDETPANEPVDLEEFPNIARYFERHKKTLESRKYYGRTMEELSRKYYELWNPDSNSWDTERKILTPRTSNGNNFAMDERHYFGLGSLHVVKLKDTSRDFYLYVLGLLNSSLIDFYFRNISPFMQSRYYQYDSQYLQKVPLVIPPEVSKDPAAKRIIELVRAILESAGGAAYFPTDYYPRFQEAALELDTVVFSSSHDHATLSPSITAKSAKEYVIYPGEGEDPIWIDSEVKAEYVALALRERSVKEGDKIQIMVPRSEGETKNVLQDYLGNLGSKIEDALQSRQVELDKLVYSLYDIDLDGISLVEDYLEEETKSVD